MDTNIQEFIQGKRFALVGASRSGKKFGNDIYTELKERGYEVTIVHPETQDIGGEFCSPNLKALEGKVDGVIICVSPQKASAVIREAVEAGIRRIWLQMGAQSAETETLARELGVQVVTGKCILMYAQPVRSVHGWHRTFAKIFGQY
jgi:uncharacterized protein